MGKLCAQVEGYNVQAATRVPANDRTPPVVPRCAKPTTGVSCRCPGGRHDSVAASRQNRPSELKGPPGTLHRDLLAGALQRK